MNHKEEQTKEEQRLMGICRLKRRKWTLIVLKFK